MAEQDSQTPQPVINALLASGFPFQTAVARMVRQVPGCALLGEEVPWRDETGSDQFLDLIATKGRFVVTVECKKTEKEIFTFLQPGGADGDVNRVRCIYLTQNQDVTKRMELFCTDWWFMPKSAESAFCVVSTSESGRDQRMLERDVQRLVRGTDAYAQRRKRSFHVTGVSEADRPILPVLVTNAKLFAAEYDPANVSLETGQLPMPRPATLSPVEWVRFRKGFTSAGNDVGERTVFVVRASALAKWFEKLEFIRDRPSDEGRVHIP
jgi:hypothetical protein